MSEENGKTTIRSKIVHRNYNVVTGKPFSAVEIAQNQVYGDQIMNFTHDIESVKAELLDKYNEVSLKLNESDFMSFNNSHNENNVRNDDWESIPEYKDKLNALNIQLGIRTQNKIQELVKESASAVKLNKD